MDDENHLVYSSLCDKIKNSIIKSKFICWSEKMKIKKMGKLLTGSDMKHFIMSAVFYFILILPYKYLFAIIPSNEAKTAAFLPAVLGILWGPAGAIGAATANFAGDLFAGHVLYAAITGGVANFFQAYIPYKLWYTFKADERTKYFLYDINSIFKYTYILLITSLVTNAMTAMVGESSKMFAGNDMFIRGFVNQFEASLVFGIPLLILFSNKKIRPCLPKMKKRPTNGTAAFSYDILLYLVIMIEAGYILVAGQSGIAMRPVVAFFCWIVMFLMLSIFMLKPVYDWVPSGKMVEPVQRPIFAKVVLSFILIGCMFAGAIGWILYGLIQQNMLVNDLHTWKYLYANVGWAVQFVFLLLLFFLWRVERNLVKPVRYLTGAVRQLASVGNRMDLANQALAIGVPSKAGDEIEQLANALRRMFREVNPGMNDLPLAAVVDHSALIGVLDPSRMQRLLLPNAVSMRPAKESFEIQALLCQGNGDHYCFYDFFMLDEKKLLICVADTMDEVQPLLYMALIKALLRRYAQEGYSPSELLAHINEQLYVDGGSVVSIFIGMTELSSGKILCASAGLIAAAICRNGKSAEWARIPSGETLMSEPHLKYDEFQVLLGEGDSLFLCANTGEDSEAEESVLQAVFNQCREEKIADDVLLHTIAERSGRIHDEVQVGDLAMLFFKRKFSRKKKLFVLRRG